MRDVMKGFSESIRRKSAVDLQPGDMYRRPIVGGTEVVEVIGYPLDNGGKTVSVALETVKTGVVLTDDLLKGAQIELC